VSRAGGGVGVDLGVEDGVPGTAPTGGALETIRRRMAGTEEKASEEGKVGEEKTPQRWKTTDTCSKILLIFHEREYFATKSLDARIIGRNDFPASGVVGTQQIPVAHRRHVTRAPLTHLAETSSH